MTKKKCPICTLPLDDEGRKENIHQYRCMRCGAFRLTTNTKSLLRYEFSSDNDLKRTILSHAIQRMQSNTEWPLLDNVSYKKILHQNSLPKPAEQARNLLLWLGKTAEASDSTITISCEELQATIGGRQPDSVYYIASHLQNQHLITYQRTDNSKATPPLAFQMTFDGWSHYDQLMRETTESRTAFMAMKYGDAELDSVVKNIFRPAVEATGFELRILIDIPKAGLIDDHLRVEIRRCQFLIADITHSNPGAYWEAGFAEGLGKPVIYTCKKEAFDANIAHFDTNHHLTVKWHNDKNQVIEDLKATIRATLPSEAKLND